MELTITELVFLLVFIPIIFIGLLSFFHNLQIKHFSKKKLEKIYFCKSCKAVYTIVYGKIKEHCPRCNNINDFIDVNRSK